MKRRNCPNCNEILGEYDYFFCSACGEKLPEELVRKPHSIRIKTYKLEKSTKKATLPIVKKIKDKKFIYSFLLLTFIGVVLAGIYSTGITDLIMVQFSDGGQNVVIPEEVVENTNIVKTDENVVLKKGDFSKTDLATYFPSETDFYFEAFDISNFSSYFSNIEGLSELFTRSQVLFESNFAGGYLVDPNSWVFVFGLKDETLVEKILEDLENENWELYLFDEVLVMAQKEDLVDEIKDVEEKISPSLALNSSYVKKIQKLPSEGAVKVVFMNENIKSSFSQYYEVLNEDISPLLRKVVNSSGYSFLVE